MREAAPAVDRVLPADGVPARPDLHRPARPRASGCSASRCPAWLDDVAATGATVVDDDLDPVADLVRAQLLAVRRAEAAGLDPDRPRTPDPLGRARGRLTRDPLRLPQPGGRRDLPRRPPASQRHEPGARGDRSRPGGKAVNVARVLHRLGEPTSRCSPRSAAGPARSCRRRPGRARVPTRRWSPTAPPTRRTVTVVEPTATDATTLRRAGRARLLARARRSASRRARADADVRGRQRSVPDGAPATALAALVVVPAGARAARSSSTPAARRCCRRWRRGRPWSSRTPTSSPGSPATTTRCRAARTLAPSRRGDRRGLARRGRRWSRRRRRRLGGAARAARCRQPHRRRRRPGRRPGARAAARPRTRPSPELLLPTRSPSRPPPCSRPRPATSTRPTTASSATASSSAALDGAPMTVVGDRRPDRRGAAARGARCRPST